MKSSTPDLLVLYIYWNTFFRVVTSIVCIVFNFSTISWLKVILTEDFTFTLPEDIRWSVDACWCWRMFCSIVVSVLLLIIGVRKLCCVVFTRVLSRVPFNLLCRKQSCHFKGVSYHLYFSNIHLICNSILHLILKKIDWQLHFFFSILLQFS